jgi:hypothetical protein
MTSDPLPYALRQHVDRWIPPPHGTTKINWYVVLDLVNKRMGIGVVIRDDKGGVVDANRLGNSGWSSQPIRLASHPSGWQVNLFS